MGRKKESEQSRPQEDDIEEKKEILPKSLKKRPQEDDVGVKSKKTQKEKQIKCCHRLPTKFSQIGNRYVII